MILLFKYNNKCLKFTPNDKNYDLKNYADTNLPNGTRYKIIENLDGLTDEDCYNLVSSSEQYSTNTEF